jgi:hypothetical protein
MSTTDTLAVPPAPQDPRDPRPRDAAGDAFADAPYSEALYSWSRAHGAYVGPDDPADVPGRKETWRRVGLTAGALVVAAGLAAGLVYGLGYGHDAAPIPADPGLAATAPARHAPMPAHVVPGTGATAGTAGTSANGGSSNGGHVAPPAPPAPSAAIETLQKELGQLNYYEGPVTGVMNAQTTQAITYLQRDAGLPQTGQMNAATQAALARMLATGNNQMNGNSQMNGGNQTNGGSQMNGGDQTNGGGQPNDGKMGGMPGM